jgi:UDP-N-acetyl-D-glucosamine dehydrogenase
MPLYVINKVIDALNSVRKPVNGSKVLVLGVAYKKNIDDLRESPAIDIIGLLEERGAEVCYHDPYIPTMEHEGVDHRSVELTESLLQEADCVVIVTDHSNFDYEWIANCTPLIVDSRNALAKVRHPQAQIFTL